MKKIITLALALIAFTVANAIDITTVDKVKPNDQMFMDMAVTAATKSVSSGTGPTGAVIILNGAWKSTGIPEAGKPVEQVAVDKAHLSSLKNASIYTVVQPTTEMINLLNSKGIDAIYFVIPADKAVSANVYSAEAYDESALDTSVKQAPMIKMTFAEAEALYK